MNQTFQMPDFIEIQRTNFFYLLEKGISSELQRIGPIESKEGEFKLIFDPKSIYFKKPRISTSDAIKHKKTYSCSLYVWGEWFYDYRLVLAKTMDTQSKNICVEKELFLQKGSKTDLKENKTIRKRCFKFPICLGQIPIITSQGHFIINGSPRVVVSQLIRNPGVYFSSTFDRKSQKKLYQASFISNQGSWLRLEYDRKGHLWARVNRLKKVPIYLFLRAIGLPKQKMAKILKFKDKRVEDSELSANPKIFEGDFRAYQRFTYPDFENPKALSRDLLTHG